MVDFRVHDGFPNHPKTIDLTLEAIGLWTLAGCWCARYHTDGLIPTRILEGFAGKRTQRLVQDLTDAHLFAPLNGGYVFVDWAQYQLTRDEITRTASLNRTRQARFRARQRAANPDE